MDETGQARCHSRKSLEDTRHLRGVMLEKRGVKKKESLDKKDSRRTEERSE